MSDTAEKITEVVAETAEFVSEQAADFAEFARVLNKVKIQFGLLGVAIGTAGGAAAFVLAYRKAERKYSKIADSEIEVMREHYQIKGKALEAQVGKRDLANLVTERGYTTETIEVTTTPPMSVHPPTSLTTASNDDSAMAEDEIEGPEGVKAIDAQSPIIQNIFRETKMTHEWDIHEERRRRNPTEPYVIHNDERYEMDGYNSVSLTYYAEDDVLCDDVGDGAIADEQRESLVGEANLERFGHGSGDANIVFVRNDSLEIVYEIVKSPNSYAQEVHGLSHEGYDRKSLMRMRARERDDER